METADLRQRYDLAYAGRLDGARCRRVLSQGRVRSRTATVGEVGLQDPVQVLLTEDNDVIEALSTDRADEAFGVGILPRRSRRCQYLLNAHALDTTVELLTVDTVAVTDHVFGRGVLRKCLDDLLGGPLCARVAGDVPVDDASAVMGEDEKDVEDVKGAVGTVKKSMEALEPR